MDIYKEIILVTLLSTLLVLKHFWYRKMFSVVSILIILINLFIVISSQFGFIFKYSYTTLFLLLLTMILIVGLFVNKSFLKAIYCVFLILLFINFYYKIYYSNYVIIWKGDSYFFLKKQEKIINIYTEKQAILVKDFNILFYKKVDYTIDDKFIYDVESDTILKIMPDQTLKKISYDK